MQRSPSLIVDFIYNHIQGSIYRDIERCIEAEASHVVALALLSYTEFIGGLISGNLGKKGHSEKNFKKALEFFPDKYKIINSSIQLKYAEKGTQVTRNTSIYEIFRCGLVHEYFIKGHVIIHSNPDGHADDHIGILRNEQTIKFPSQTGLPPYQSVFLEFHTNEYFRDFKSAVGKIIKLLLIDQDTKSLKKVNESLDRIRLRRIIVN